MGICTPKKMGYLLVATYFTDKDTNHDDYMSAEAKAQASIRVKGRMAEELGLSGVPFTEDLFRNALKGRFPKGDHELADKFDPKFVTVDMMFAPSKSFSLEIEVRGDQRLLEIHRAAVAAAMAQAENLVVTRITKDGKTETVSCSGAAWVEFDHNTTRSHGDDRIEPQTHTHAALIKYVLGADGKLHCMESRDIFAAQKSLGAVYDATFYRLAIEAGYPITLTKNGPEIAGYTREFLAEFSGPRAAMATWLAERGIDIDRSTEAQRRAANIAMRDTKTYHNRENLAEWWQARAEALGGLPEVKMNEKPERLIEVDARAAVHDAINHLTKHQASMQTRHQILEQAIRLSDLAVDPAKANAVIDGMFESEELLKRNLGQRIVTSQTLEQEKQLEQNYSDGIDKVEPIGDLELVRKHIELAEAKLGGKMTPSQVRMINGVIVSKDGEVVIEGDAGTGKSSGLAAVKAAADEMGIKILGLAPSKQAVDSLAEAGIPTWTAQSAGSGAAEKTRQEFWSQVVPGTRIVLDEAGLLGREAMLDLQQRAADKQAQLIVCGDTKQFSSVESGSALRQLYRSAEKAGKEIRLDDMRRGKTDEIRGLHEAARDNPEQAIRSLYEAGRVISAVDPKRRHAIIAEKFAALGPEDREISLVMTGMNRDRLEINKAIRAKLNLEPGVIARVWNPSDLSSEQKQSIASYEPGAHVTFQKPVGPFKAGEMVQLIETRGHLAKVMREDGTIANFTPRTQGSCVRGVGYREDCEISRGDLIRFSANKKNDGIVNGDRARVLSVDADKFTATVQLVKDNKTIEVNLKQKDLAIKYGYSQTGHSTQGVTAKSNVWLHATSDDPTVNANSFYTNITRSTTHIELVTDARNGRRVAKLMRKVGQAADPDLARLRPEDLVRKATPPAFWPKEQRPGECEYIRVNDHKNPMEIAQRLIEAQDKYGNQFGVTGGDKFKAQVADVITNPDGSRMADISFDKSTEAVVKQVIQAKTAKFNELNINKEQGNGIYRRGNRERTAELGRVQRPAESHPGSGAVQSADLRAGQSHGRGAQVGLQPVPRSVVARDAGNRPQRRGGQSTSVDKLLQPNAHHHPSRLTYALLRRAAFGDGRTAESNRESAAKTAPVKLRQAPQGPVQRAPAGAATPDRAKAPAQPVREAPPPPPPPPPPPKKKSNVQGQ